MVWAAPGKDKATLAGFFDALAASGAAVGEDRCAGITHVSADGADWIEAVVRERCLNAVRCADPFHIVRWAAEALDSVRREAWNTARRGAGGSRYVGAVHGRPQHQAKGYARSEERPLGVMAEPGEPQQLPGSEAGVDRQERSPAPPRLPAQRRPAAGLPTARRGSPRGSGARIGWARRSRFQAFIDLQRRIVKHREAILASIEHGLSNGRIESVNAEIRLITRVAFGFRSPDVLIALAMLNLGGHRPALPGRK